MKTLLDNREIVSVIVTIVMLVTVLITGCEEPNTVTPKITNIKVDGVILREIELEGCEYFWFGGSQTSGLAHKGNCKNH